MNRLAILSLTLLLWIAAIGSYLASGGMATRALAFLPSLCPQESSSSNRAETDPRSSGQVIATSPMNARGYFARGLAAEGAGDHARARGLVQHSVHLDPRLPEARLWMGVQELKHSRVPQAVAHLVVVSQLRRSLRPQLAALFAEAARNEEARFDVARRLANDWLILAVTQQAALAGMSPTELRQLLSHTDLSRLNRGVASAQTSVIRGPLHEGDYGSAYLHWRALLPGTSPENPIFDGDFEEREAAPPFNWTRRSGGDVSFHALRLGFPNHPTGLEIRSFASTPVMLIEQTIVLPPGAYELSALVKSPGTGGGFEWSVRCKTGPVIAETSIQAEPIWRRKSWELLVPANCTAQQVQLRSRANDENEALILQITGVRIRRIGLE